MAMYADGKTPEINQDVQGSLRLGIASVVLATGETLNLTPADDALLAKGLGLIIEHDEQAVRKANNDANIAEADQWPDLIEFRGLDGDGIRAEYDRRIERADRVKAEGKLTQAQAKAEQRRTERLRKRLSAHAIDEASADKKRVA